MNKNLEIISEVGLRYPTNKSKQKKHYSKVLCICGVVFEAQTYDVKRGHTKSCGCSFKNKNVKHGLRKHPLYGRWKNMKTRCYNKNNKSFLDYGQRGIKICDEWLNDFKSFYDWAIDNGYNKHLTLDRIDNNGNYEPSNCRFTNRETQSANTRKIRKSNTSGYRGVSFKKSTNKWQSHIRTKGKDIYLGYFKTSLEASNAYDKYIIANNLPHTLNNRAKAE